MATDQKYDMRGECHCGVMGHPLNSINCPVHGQRAGLDEYAIRMICREEIAKALEHYQVRRIK